MREYGITMKARRFSWLPWLYVCLTFRKATTWEDAYNMAVRAAESGAWDVRVGLVDASGEGA